MRNAALVLGILAGLWGMMVGFISWGYTSLAEVEGAERWISQVDNVLLTRGAGLLAPMLAIAGGAMVHSYPRLSGVLLLVSAAGMFGAFGFHFYTMFAIAMAALAGLMALGADGAKAE